MPNFFKKTLLPVSRVLDPAATYTREQYAQTLGISKREKDPFKQKPAYGFRSLIRASGLGPDAPEDPAVASANRRAALAAPSGSDQIRLQQALQTGTSPTGGAQDQGLRLRQLLGK